MLGIFYIDWSERLLAVREWLSDTVFQINNPENWGKQTGFLNFLLNPAVNPRTINTIETRNANSGTFRTVQIRYTGHDGDQNMIETDASANCNAVAQKRDSIQNVNPDLYCEAKFTLDELYVLENAENGDTLEKRMQRELTNAMRKMRECIDKNLLTQAAANLGANPAGGVGAGQYIDTAMLISADGKIDDRNWDKIHNDMEDNFQKGPYSIVGLGNARKYFNRLNVGGLNDNGVDYKEVLALYGMAFYKDHFTADVLGGANRVLVFAPGLTQFYQYNLYKGPFAEVFDQEWIRTTIQDPVYPAITYDYIISFDRGCTTGDSTGHLGSFTHRIFTYYDLYIVPEAAWGDTYGDLNDFNGIVGYNVTES